jgi:hypothetical protein
VAETFIKPNDRLTSFDRLEIYNRVYWFRVLDCLYDDYPGLRGILGERKFMKLITAYLAKYPSASFTLRNLGSRLEQFLREEPRWVAPRAELALDMVRFEWAQVVATWTKAPGTYIRYHRRFRSTRLLFNAKHKRGVPEHSA